MAGRPQPGIRDAYTSVSPRVAERGTPRKVTYKTPGIASPYSRFSQYAQGAAQRAKSQDKKKKDQGGGNFITDELLGFDDFSWAVKNAQKGNWWDAAKSLGAGVLELGDTVASGAAIALTGGAATGAVAAKYALKTGAKQVAKQAAEEGAQAAAKPVLTNVKTMKLDPLANYKKEFDTIVKRANETKPLDTRNVDDDYLAISRSMDFPGSSKAQRWQNKLDARDKTPDQLAKELLDDLNPFKKPQTGRGRSGKGKGEGGGSGTGKGPGSGSGTGSGTGGGSGGGVRNADELATVGANRSGVARYADDTREPLSRPVQPQNNRPMQPGTSSSGEAVEEAVEQTVLRSNAEDVLKTGGLTLKSRRLVPAGILGMGMAVLSQSGTRVTQGTAVTPTLSTPTTTTTGTSTTLSGIGGGGGGGRRPAFDTGGGKVGADVTIPYTY